MRRFRDEWASIFAAHSGRSNEEIAAVIGARIGSVNRAAKMLGVTPPPVTPKATRVHRLPQHHGNRAGEAVHAVTSVSLPADPWGLDLTRPAERDRPPIRVRCRVPDCTRSATSRRGRCADHGGLRP